MFWDDPCGRENETLKNSKLWTNRNTVSLNIFDVLLLDRFGQDDLSNVLCV